ncbi:hypothetical protein [Synechocystis sp. FACHB-383]|nr:hypothetical protein [Synechocystis sp. FACHB-383]
MVVTAQANTFNHLGLTNSPIKRRSPTPQALAFKQTVTFSRKNVSP